MIAPAGKNMLLEKVQYKVNHTPMGVWRRFMYADGRLFEEYHTHAQVMGLPLVHYTKGVCPETGRTKFARGFVAVGRRAMGFVAIGQMAIGVLAIGQLAIGLVLGFGQASTGLLAVGQVAIAGMVAVGQFAGGPLAIGQFALGWVAMGPWAMGVYAYGHLGVGIHVWSTSLADAEAVRFFNNWRQLWPF